MAFVNGKWEVETNDIGADVAKLTSSANPLIQQARASGYAGANRRGLINSSMAVGAAEGEAYKIAAPLASQMSAQRNQLNMQRLDSDAQSTRQGADIAAQMARLREQAGFDKERLGMELGSRERLALGDNEAQMARLRVQLAGADAQQRREIEAQMARLREQNTAEMARLDRSGELDTAAREQQGLIQGRLNQQQSQAEMARLQSSLAAEMARLNRQITSAEGQQRADLEAQRERLEISGRQEMERLEAAAGFDLGRIEAQGAIDLALQTSGAEQQRALASLQGNIQSALQTQQDAAQLQRMGAQFAQELAMQQRDNAAALDRIRETGDQQLRDTLARAEASANELAMQLAAGDRAKVAELSVEIFRSEAALRAALLSNPNMPASERAAYERAIGALGNPARKFINDLYAAPPAAPAPTPQRPGGDPRGDEKPGTTPTPPIPSRPIPPIPLNPTPTPPRPGGGLLPGRATGGARPPIGRPRPA